MTGSRQATPLDLAMPLLAGLSVMCAATALSGVLAGAAWFGYVVLAVLLVVGAGMAVRAGLARAAPARAAPARTPLLPTVLVAVVQALLLLCLLVVLFTGSGVLWVLPGPRALGDLGSLLAAAGGTIRTGVPPVPPDAPLRCLVTLALGAVAIVVDLLVVSRESPAVAGLPLLATYAVPAALDDRLLPWGAFVAGLASFTLLLGADRARHRRRWRGRAVAPRPGGGTANAAVAVGGLAIVVSLVAGSAVTAVGTAGRLPGSGPGAVTAAGRLGIKPFTTLRGMLDEADSPVEMFRVRGLPTGGNVYLRSLTLADYRPNQGWVLAKPLPRGVAATADPLPGQAPARGDELSTVHIRPVHWADFWLPVYGRPQNLSGIAPGWRYDPGSGIVYNRRQRHPPAYTEQAVLTEPTAVQLRSAPTRYGALDPVYLQIPAVDPRVTRLAVRLTEHRHDPFDKAVALYRYFTDPANGFIYTTSTAPGGGSDALADFLFVGKRGFCEQYASAMAVMLREVGVPSRVAIGFTSGQTQQGVHTITSHDAHAWVEVYFPGYGWQPFDPTPLTDGRGRTPDYLLSPQGPGNGAATLGQRGAAGPHAANHPPRTAPEPQHAATSPATPAAPGGTADGPGAVVVLVLLAVLLLLALAGTPAWLRWWRRRSRLRTVARLGPDAASAAWATVVAELRDRGDADRSPDTPRATAQRIVRRHRLDDDGARGLSALVVAVERAWYGGDGTTDPELPGHVNRVHASFRRNAPLRWRARLLPRSVLSRQDRSGTG